MNATVQILDKLQHDNRVAHLNQKIPTNNISSLKLREKCFRSFADKISLNKRYINDLMLEIEIPDFSLHELQSSVTNYLIKSAQTEEVINSEKSLVKLLERVTLQNMTPNGSVIGKNINSLEYNLLAVSYIKLLRSLGVDSEIDKIHFPFNVRIKHSNVSDTHLKRDHPTEFMHSDGWTGAAPSWVAIHIFLFGDIDKNYIRYAYPPEEFREEWLSPKLKSRDHQHLVQKYKLVDYKPKKGCMILADNSVIHQSYREHGAGTRVSIDSGIDIFSEELMKNTFSRDIQLSGKNVYSIRSKEEFSKETIFNIGKDFYFHFPDDFNFKIEKESGFSHAARPKLIKL